MTGESKICSGTTRLCASALSLTLLVTAAGSQTPPESRKAADHLSSGISLLQKGDLGQARVALEQATRLAPNSLAAWKALGRVHAGQANYKLAVTAFRRACDLAPKDEDACYLLGRSYYSLTRLSEAIAAFKKALDSGRRVWRAYNGMALAEESFGRSVEAERLFREAIRTYDGTANAYVSPSIDFGAFLFRQGRLEESLRVLRSAVDEQPGSARAHFELARTLVQLDLLEEAAKHLGQAVSIDPNDGPSHLLLGKVEFRLGRAAEGARQMEIGQKLTEPQQ